VQLRLASDKTHEGLRRGFQSPSAFLPSWLAADPMSCAPRRSCTRRRRRSAPPTAPARFKTANWFGAPFGAPFGVFGLALLAISLDQGGRLDWLNSPFICWGLASGLAATAVYVVSEW
jgi:hypothetical protein